MNVVDSSGWMEYFANGPNANFFAPSIEHPNDLVVPTISIYEVFKRVLQQRDEGEALQAIATMQRGIVVELDAAIALQAAKLSFTLKIPMADSIMLATARWYGATLWTQDIDFANMADVQYIVAKPRPSQ